MTSAFRKQRNEKYSLLSLNSNALLEWNEMSEKNRVSRLQKQTNFFKHVNNDINVTGCWSPGRKHIFKYKELSDNIFFIYFINSFSSICKKSKEKAFADCYIEHGPPSTIYILCINRIPIHWVLFILHTIRLHWDF